MKVSPSPLGADVGAQSIALRSVLRLNDPCSSVVKVSQKLFYVDLSGFRWIYMVLSGFKRFFNPPLGRDIFHVNPHKSTYAQLSLSSPSSYYTSCVAENTCVFPDFTVAAETEAGMVYSALQLRPELPIILLHSTNNPTRRTWRLPAPGAANTLVHIHGE